MGFSESEAWRSMPFKLSEVIKIKAATNGNAMRWYHYRKMDSSADVRKKLRKELIRVKSLHIVENLQVNLSKNSKYTNKERLITGKKKKLAYNRKTCR